MSWIYENYGKPNRCERCGQGRNVFWFSKSKKLLNEREDWMALCNGCRNKMKVEIKVYENYIKETTEKRHKAGKELSDIENKIVNNNYDEIIKGKNDTIKQKMELEEKNYNLGIEIDKKKTEIKGLKQDFNKETKEKAKREKQEELELAKLEIAIEKQLAKSNKVFIKTQKKEIKELSKHIDEFSIVKLDLKTKLKDLQENLAEANKIISDAGTMNIEIENEKNAIDKRNHKADVRERSLIRKYKRLGINITKF